MLILTRRVGETIIIGEEVRVTLLGVVGRQIKIGIDALRTVLVYLEDKFEKKTELALSSINGGTVHNAIPREFSCEFSVKTNKKKVV